ncbi:MAG: hypothetical protein IKI56_02080 [Ruminococcus sp.]|nr:hypothetical protein [Ruminococcus sp.]
MKKGAIGKLLFSLYHYIRESGGFQPPVRGGIFPRLIPKNCTDLYNFDEGNVSMAAMYSEQVLCSPHKRIDLHAC